MASASQPPFTGTHKFSAAQMERKVLSASLIAMLNQDAPWPSLLSPGNGEALPDWLRRVARSYDYLSLRDFILAAGFPFSHRSELFLRPPPGLICYLSKKARLPVRSIIEMTGHFAKYPKALYTMEHLTCGLRERVGVAWGRTSNELNSNFLALRHKGFRVFRAPCSCRNEKSLLHEIASFSVQRFPGKMVIIPGIENMLLVDRDMLAFTETLLDGNVVFGTSVNKNIYSSRYSVIKIRNAIACKRYKQEYTRHASGIHAGRRRMRTENVCWAFYMLSKGDSVAEVADFFGVNISTIHANVVVHYQNAGSTLPKTPPALLGTSPTVRRTRPSPIQRLKARIAP